MPHVRIRAGAGSSRPYRDPLQRLGVSMASAALANSVNINLLRRCVVKVLQAPGVAQAVHMYEGSISLPTGASVEPPAAIRTDVQRGSTTITVPF